MSKKLKRKWKEKGLKNKKKCKFYDQKKIIYFW